MIKNLEQKYFKTKAEFREWLENNYDQSPGILLVYYKKHTKKPSIVYREALEAALCFGWIDSTIKRLDDERYLQQFTPRTNLSNWSDTNKRLVLELMEKKEMTEAGLKKIDLYLKTGKVDWVVEATKPKIKLEPVTPDFILEALSLNEHALQNFSKLPPSHKRNYVDWISSAKREETIAKRLKEAMELLSKNEKLGYK